MDLNKDSKRETWLDNVKVVACILVVLGHFFQSMVKAGIWVENDLYRWFNQTVYFFHVPLFFMCSGYLYQKYSKIDSFDSWKKNVKKKVIGLMIPYFSFSIITWGLKVLFPDSINSPASGLLDTLLKSPISPYWYLYSLFFIFLITPTFSKKIFAYIGMGIALLLKAYALVVGECSIYVISTILTNEIWFVTGMFLCVIDFRTVLKRLYSLYLGILMLIIFLCISVIIFQDGINNSFVNVSLGIVACLSILMLMHSFFPEDKQNRIWTTCAKYTFPIFLMHTIFAAATRIILLELGVRRTFIHTVLGLMASFVGPILAANIMEKYRWMDIFIYPQKYIKMNR